MRLSFRLVCSLVVVLALVSLLFSYVQFRGEKQALRQDLRKRSQILAESLQESIEPALEKSSRRDLQRLVERFGDRERLTGIPVLDLSANPVVITPRLSAAFPNTSFMPLLPADNTDQASNPGEFRMVNGRHLYVFNLPLNTSAGPAGTLAVVHDSGYINVQSWASWRQAFFRISVEMFLIGVTALLIFRLSISGPVARTVEWMKASRTGKAATPGDRDLFMPLRKEVATLVESLTAARESAEREARLREAADATWTAERLSVHVRTKLGSSRLFVVSNREPYM